MHNLTSPRHKAKGLGSTNSGVVFWVMQHLTAAIMLFAVPRGAYTFCRIITTSTRNSLNIALLKNNFIDAFLLWILLVVGLIHGAMGCKIVIEDYVEPKWFRITLSFFMQFLVTVTVIILSVIILNIAK